MHYELELTKIIKSDDVFMSILKNVQALQLNDCWVAAGVIRNKVWDYLHNLQTEINDIDVIYFDKSDRSTETEKFLESKLQHIMPTQPWSVKNQARMHIKNKVSPYLSSFDGVAHFPETPTAIAVRLNNEKIEIMAPYGLSDLFEGIVRPTPPFNQNANLHTIYLNRIQNKNWRSIWYNLIIKSE
ncbi:nucleotidyltransferase family protein [Solibacillus faecavium]|nr:nucleotidyltransferase family protein [Solibacillus faecavium]